MSVKIDDETGEEPTTLKQRCVKCFKGVNLLKTLVIVGCIVLSGQQILVCIEKLIDIPITTYTHFDFNKSIAYPSVTFCREPPYKYDKLVEYELYAHPRYTSTWRNFNFSRITLDELWEVITYNEQEFLVQFGLDGLADNVEIRSTLGFVFGRCLTLSPKILNNRPTKSSGYSITLQHSSADIANSLSTYPPGYHVYVHYTKEPFTEVEVYNGGLVDYLYINTGEAIDVKLTVDEYIKISKEDDPCTHLSDYSANDCTSQFVWDIVAHQAGCSGPWMRSNLPRCDNYTTMRNLISAYMNTYNNHDCNTCPRFCRAYLYNAFVTDRQTFVMWDSSNKLWLFKSGDAALQSQIYLHFNSMMVSVYEERYNYDWNLFLSDLGGSIGFLLGLSVIGLISIMGNIWSSIIVPSIKQKKIRKDGVSVISSTLTTDVAVICKDRNLTNEYKEWIAKKNYENNT